MTKTWKTGLLLLALSAALYAGALAGPYLWDDVAYMVHVPLYRDWRGLRVLFSPEEFFRQTGHFNYRPVFVATSFLHWALGLKPWLSRLLGIAVHAAAALGLWAVARRLVRDGSPSDAAKPLLAAALFTVHPAHHETVVCATLVHDLLCAAFFLWALETRSVLLYALALLTKEMALVFLPVLFLYERLRGLRPGWRAHAPHLAVTAAYLFLRFGPLKNPLAAAVAWNGGTLWTNLLTVPKVLVVNWKVLLWPWPLAIDYAVRPVVSLADPWFWSGLALAAAVGALAWAQRRTRPVVAFGSAFAGLAMVPVLNLIPIPGVFAERYLVLPSAGLALALAWLLPRPALAVLLLAQAGVVLARHRDWTDGLALYSSAIRAQPGSGVARAGLANELRARGRLEEAELHYLEAIRLDPGKVMPYANLALTYQQRGRLADAEALYRRAIALDPKYPEAHGNLGMILEDTGRLAEAVAEYETALALDPVFVEAWSNLSGAYGRQGRHADAEKAARRALALKPDFPEARYLLGRALLSQGRRADAEAEFRESLRLRPGWPPPAKALAAPSR